MRPLQRLCNKSLADILDQCLLRRDVPVLSLKIVRRLCGPDLQNLVDSLEEHLVAVGIEIPEQLRVRQKSAGADPENQTPAEHMVKHCHAGGYCGGVGVRHVD